MLDFAFFDNWIGFTSKELLTFTKIHWNKTMWELRQKKDVSLYDKLYKVLQFIDRWNIINDESVLKYMSSTPL